MCIRDRFGAIPVHEGKVGVLGVFFAGEKGGCEFPSLGRRNALEAAGEVEADEGGGAVPREFGELLEGFLSWGMVLQEKGDGAGADVFVLVAELSVEETWGDLANAKECPEGTEFVGNGLGVLEDSKESCLGAGQVLALVGTLLEKAAGMAGEPFVFVGLELGELDVV